MQEGMRLCAIALRGKVCLGLYRNTFIMLDSRLQSYYAFVWNFKYWKMGKEENEMEEKEEEEEIEEEERLIRKKEEGEQEAEENRSSHSHFL